MPPKKKPENNLDDVLASIHGKFGTEVIRRLGDISLPKVDVISSGSIRLDEALGIGGLPRGRVVEIYGPESSGKTSLALHAVAKVQKQGGAAAFIDAEHAFDPAWAETLGVDTDQLLVSQPDYGEQGLEVAQMLADSGKVAIIVIDSVAALVPKKEIDGEMGDTHVGLQARMMSQALRKLTASLNHTKTTCVFINQLREKVGVFFGSPETTTGGKALKFYATVRLDVRRIQTLKDGDLAVGNRVRVKVVKNKMAPPFKQAEFDFLYSCGVSTAGELIDMGIERGVIKKSGAWYTNALTGEQLGQGREKTRLLLMSEPELFAQLEKSVRGNRVVVPQEKPSSDEDGGLVGRGEAPWEE